MNNDDDKLRSILQARQQQKGRAVPSFDVLFSAAENQVQRSRRNRYISLAGAAAVLVFALTFALLPASEEEFTYVDLQELTASTSWSAPSDSLLPHHEFDIYRELPWLIESTEPDEGALL